MLTRRAFAPSMLVLLVLPEIASAYAPDFDLVMSTYGTSISDGFGLRVGSAGDINADGYPDLAVGSVGDDEGGHEAGALFIYLGGPDPSGTYDFKLTGDQPETFLGWASCPLPDVNGDGYTDLAVSAVGVWSIPSGAPVRIYFGGPDFDEVHDLEIPVVGEWFGLALNASGDFDSDGNRDLAIGAPLSGGDAGRVYVYRGPSFGDSPDYILGGSHGDEEFGGPHRIAFMDYNGDGHDDLVVGADRATPGETGRVYVFFGGDDPDELIDLELVGPSTGARFGQSVVNAGDLNADGWNDLAVGAGGSDQVVVYFAGPAYADSTNVVIQSPRIGGSVAGVGDVTNDGVDDLLIKGDPDVVYLHIGGADFDDVPDRIITKPDDSEDFGYSMASLGDFNHDGLPEVAFGSPNRETTSQPGSAYVLQPQVHDLVAAGFLCSSDSSYAWHEAPDELSVGGIVSNEGTEPSVQTHTRLQVTGCSGFWAETFIVPPLEPGASDTVWVGPFPVEPTQCAVSLVVDSLDEFPEASEENNGLEGSACTVVSVEESSEVHAAMVLYPNPSRGGVTIVGGPDPVKARIYDATGRVVRELDRARHWDGRTSAGIRVPAGVYWVRAETGTSVQTARVQLLR